MLPMGVMSTLGNVTSRESNSFRSIVYIPRPRGGTRYLRNEIQILQQLCHKISFKSKLILSIFLPKNDFKVDRYGPISNARLILAVHGGALAK
jgi:hypothetical protein